MGSTEIVKATVEIIPRPNLEGIDVAVERLKLETEKLTPLAEKEKAVFSMPSGPERIQAAKLLQTEVRALAKAAGFNLDPYWQVVNNTRDALSRLYEGHEGKAKLIDDSLKALVKSDEAEEKRRADIETARINRERVEAEQKKAAEEKAEKERVAKEEREKKVKEIKAAVKRGDIGKREAKKMLEEAGATEEAKLQQAEIDAETQVQAVRDAPVTVQPNIPKVAGVPSRTNYKAEIVNFEQLLRAFVTAKEIERMVYLRQFLCANEQAIGAEARRVKDSKKLESLIPGIRAYED